MRYKLFTLVILCFCFYAEIIYLIIRSLADPRLNRLEEQPTSFSLIIVLSTLIPVLLILMKKKLDKSVAYLFCIFILIVAFFLLSFGNNSSHVESSLSDFLKGSVFFIKGIVIAQCVILFDEKNSFFEVLMKFTVLLSLLFLTVVYFQLKEGMIYPGIGGATYQRASYIAIGFTIYLYSYCWYFPGTLSKLKFYLYVMVASAMIIVTIYNGGRGALAVLLLFALIFFVNMFS